MGGLCEKVIKGFKKHFLYFVEQKQNKSSTQEAIMENNISNLIQL